MIKKMIFLTTIVVSVYATGYSMDGDRVPAQSIRVSDADAARLVILGAGTLLAIRAIAGAEHVSVDERWASIGRIVGAWGRGIGELVPAAQDGE